MAPLVEVGTAIRDCAMEVSVAEYDAFDDVIDEDLQAISELTDEELAGLGMALSILCAGGDYDKFDDSNLYVDCLKDALGITKVQGFIDFIQGGSFAAIYKGTKQLITAKTVIQILRAMGLRYLGWLGVATMIYDFAVCVKAG